MTIDALLAQYSVIFRRWSSPNRWAFLCQRCRPLLAVGALAASGRVSIPLVLGAIALVALTVDFGWYELGRRRA